MPPRVSPASSRGGRGGGRGRGGPARGISPQPSAAPQGPASHIQTIGIRRPNFGTSGKTIPIMVNAFTTTIPDGIIYHYDGALNAFFLPFIYLSDFEVESSG
jgi:eukaryotic translation initiation factor 2C